MFTPRGYTRRDNWDYLLLLKAWETREANTGTLYGLEIMNDFQVHDSRGVFTPTGSPIGNDPCAQRNIETCLPLLKVRKTEVGNAKGGLEDNEETRIQAPKGNIESTKPTHSLSLLLLLII